ncbi:hypothetical protein ACOBQJ_14380 [Pelotomaculum propionicicum]|uniref:hypothetical protein n=1 Tax=Pelotomaculum propionicicum TaxID=258475 RepID=UPI003B76A283
MEWTRFRLTLLLCAAAVVWGVTVSVAEFNYRVRPEVPLYAFKVERQGPGLFQVDFLGERVSLALPLDQATPYTDSEKLRIYREQAASFSDSTSRSVKVFLSETSTKLNEWIEVLKEDLIFYSSSWEDLITLEE